MHLPSLGADARYPGYVAWCRKAGNAYRIGITFIDEHALFGARMSEQVCQIARYCRLHERPESTPQQVEALAREWVTRHAGEFSREAFAQPTRD